MKLFGKFILKNCNQCLHQFFFRLVEMPASGFCYPLVNYVLNLPGGQWSFLGNSNYRRTVINAHQFFFRLVEMTLGLVHASCRLPEWQAIKQTFFAPCLRVFLQNVNSMQELSTDLSKNLSIFPLLHFNVWPKIFVPSLSVFRSSVINRSWICLWK